MRGSRPYVQTCAHIHTCTNDIPEDIFLYSGGIRSVNLATGRNQFLRVQSAFHFDANLRGAAVERSCVGSKCGSCDSSRDSRYVVVNVNVEAGDIGGYTADWKSSARAVADCAVCEMAIALEVLVVTIAIRSINLITDPNSVYSHTGASIK
jgi:hypothetical protein